MPSQNPEGVLKMKKLKKLVLNSLGESGITEDETQLSGMLEHKVRPLKSCTVSFYLYTLFRINNQKDTNFS